MPLRLHDDGLPLIYLWVKPIGGRFRIAWEDHDDRRTTAGEVVGIDRPTSERAIDLLNDLHVALAAAAIEVIRSDGPHGPRLVVHASTARIEAATRQKFGHSDDDFN